MTLTTDHRHSSSNPITTIAAVRISGPDIEGKEPLCYVPGAVICS